MSSANTYAKKSLNEKAREDLKVAFESGKAGSRRVLWWDHGGHLKSLLQRTADKLGATFIAREDPLAFRAWVASFETPADEPDRVVWYVPDAKRGRDWFRDINHQGQEIEKSIEKLAAELYNLQSWQLRTWDETQPVSDAVAEMLLDKLNGTGRPNLVQLQGFLVTEGEQLPLEEILQEERVQLPDTPDALSKIKELLAGELVPGIEGASDLEAVVHHVRRWAVAGSLQAAGVPTELFPDAVAKSDLSHAHRKLTKALRNASPSVLRVYQQDYWPEVIDQVDDPWQIADCPVEGALDRRLWESWFSAFEKEAYAECQSRAQRRVVALKKGLQWDGGDITKNAPALLAAWHQAEALAALGQRYTTLEDASGPWHKQYADLDSGSWLIDRAVRRIIISGKPEESLRADHPARASLDEYRTPLVHDRYIAYLRETAEKTKQAFASGGLLSPDFLPSVKFWTENEEELASRSEVVLFYLDALRLDLARDLKERLQEHFKVSESTWMGVLPSETAFGMEALLPGRWKAFRVKMRNGILEAFRNDKRLQATRRKAILREEGYAVTDSFQDVSAWKSDRVVYFNTELDEIGENNFDKIEKKLAVRVNELAELITAALRKGNVSRAYVATDHGFVLLPEGASFERLEAPAGVDVARRRYAAENAEPNGHGITLEQSADFPYLDAAVHVLVDPQHRFSKQSISDSRYYHGGALPQECVLSFLTIEQS